ncbi:uncharacterized protein LOC111116891 isoform X2 [Crassostrea virginica]
MDLRQRWLELGIDRLKASEDVVLKWWGQIEEQYSEAQRRYHTLHHLEEMFRHFDQYSRKLMQPELVSLAIFFHDIIYDPKAPDNEEKSADLFLEFSGESDCLITDQADRVKQWILQTKSHNIQENSEKDLQYFLDMDMAVLGRQTEDYKIYSKQIREEYKHVPDSEYRKRRSAVCRHMFRRRVYIGSEELYSATEDICYGRVSPVVP